MNSHIRFILIALNIVQIYTRDFVKKNLTNPIRKIT